MNRYAPPMTSMNSYRTESYHIHSKCQPSGDSTFTSVAGFCLLCQLPSVAGAGAAGLLT